MLNSLREVLLTQGDQRTPEEFARANGIDIGKPPPQTQNDIRSFVEKNLADSSQLPRSPIRQDPLTDNVLAMSDKTDQVAQPMPSPTQDLTDSSLTRSGEYSNTVSNVAPAPDQLTTSALPAALPDATPITSPTAPTAPTIPTTGTTLPSANVSAPVAPSTPSIPTAPTTFGPQQFTDSFTRGMDMGTPLSTSTEALTQNVMDTAFHPTPPTQPDFAPSTSNYSPPTVPSSGHAIFDAPATSVEPAQATESSTLYAAPVAPVAAAPIAPAGPVVPSTTLPAYGADLRPPVAATPAPPPPLAAAPTSAPVNPSAGAGALNQQAVVRQQPTAATPPVTPTGLTEAAFATSAGAVAGATSAEAAKRTRLQDLLEAVARQEPKLRWAIGEREDGITVLVTDLASGWIPPHVEIPTGTTVLLPERRAASLGSLLPDTEIVESWSPGQFLPDAKDVEQVPMSIRSRDLPQVDDLNWELTQAANWRDGLPRLAHTLAKAGVAGTGILDTEAELLREHLHAQAQKVLATYPNADPQEIGNWQLLAAIDALIAGRKTTVNYHFAWFQALQGGR